MNNMINLNSFSTELRELVFAVEQQIPAAHPIIVSGIMTCMATAMQDLIKVRMPNGVINPVSLAIGVIGESGDRKTSVLNLLLKPIIDFDNAAEQVFNNQLLDYEIEKRMFKITEKSIQSEIKQSIKQGAGNYKLLEEDLKELYKQAPNMPLLNTRCRSNTTIPALMRNMSRSSVGQLFVTTEAGGTINNWSMGEIGNLIGLLDGENIKVDRVSTESYEVKNKRLSCAFSLQPQLYEDILSRKGNVLMESGLIPRMLISKPISLQGYRSQRVPTHSPFIGSFYERIEELLLQVQSKDPEQPLIEMTFDAETQQYWFNFAAWLEKSIASDGFNRDVSKWVNRTLDNVSRMAALIHYYSYGDEDKKHPLIGMHALQMAIDLGMYWLGEAKILFGDYSATNKEAMLATKLLEYLNRRIRCLNHLARWVLITKQEVYSRGPRALRSAELAQCAIDYLLAQGLIEARYYQNPEAENKPNAPHQFAGYGLSPKGAQCYNLIY